MIVRALDSGNDWQLGNGKQSYKFNQGAIIQSVDSRLLSFVNDCFFDMGAGIDWIRLLGTPGTKDEIVLSCRAVILGTEGVERVNSLSATLSGSRRIIIEYNIDTIFSKQFQQTLEV